MKGVATTDTSVRISSELRNYFTANRISFKTVATILDIQPSTVSIYMAGRPFSEKTARKWAGAFGFNSDYLLSGKGLLVPGASEDNPYPLTPETRKAVFAIDQRDFISRYGDNCGVGTPSVFVPLNNNAADTLPGTENNDAVTGSESRQKGLEKLLGGVLGISAATVAGLSVGMLGTLLAAAGIGFLAGKISGSGKDEPNE